MGKGTWDELSKLINKYISRNKSKEGVVGIFTKKQIGNYPAVGMRMTNPLNRRDLALSEMTRNRQYFLFKNYEKDVLKDIIKVLEHVDKNNIKLGGELLKNLEYNFGIVKMLRKYNLKSEGIIRSGGSTPSKVLKDEAGAGPGEGIRGIRGSAQDLQSSMDEIMKLADELRPETIAKKEAAEKAIREKKFKKMWHGRAYEGRGDQYRGLSYQLAKLHEAGIIKLDDKIYKGIKEGKYHHGGAEFHTPDPNRVWRYHFGDEIFDKFDEVLETSEDTFIGPNAMETWMKKKGIKPIKVDGPKNALDYMDEVELKAHIDDAEEGINIFKSDDHFWKGHENEAEMTMQSIVQKAEEKKKFMDALKTNYPKAYEKLSWKKHVDTSHPSYKKTDKTLEEAFKEGDFEVISEGDEGFKEISERLGITARPGDNLKLEDNVIQGPWKKKTRTKEELIKKIRGLDESIGGKDIKNFGGKKYDTTAPGTYNITDHIEYIKTLEPMEAMKEANKVLKGEGRYKGLSKQDQETIVNDETVTDHIFERDPDPEDFAQGGRVGYAQGSGELEDLLQRLGMVVDGLGIYSDYNQTQRKQMQRSLTSQINVLLR